MERKSYHYKVTLLTALFLGIFNLIFSQVECNKEIYESFISNEMGIWEKHIEKMENIYKSDKNIDCLYNLTFAKYGYIVYCILTEQREKGKEYLERAEHNCDRLLKYDSLWADIYSLKAALYGFKIEFNKLKAMKYGLKSLDYMNKAMDLNDKSPRVWMEKGNISYYIPEFLGGGLEKAIDCHNKAIILFEKDKKMLQYNWLYLLVMSNLGRWYTEAEEYSKAKIIYEKILAIEPDFLWVKNELYPDLLKKMN